MARNGVGKLEFIRGYPQEFLACRDIRHTWFFLQWRGLKRTLICTSCKTRRVDEFNHRFEFVRRYYLYLPNYQSPSELELDMARESRMRLKGLAEKMGIRWAPKSFARVVNE